MLDPLNYGILLQDSSMEQLLELKITFLRSILYMAVKKATERDIEDLERQHEKFCKAIEENPEDIELLYTENLNFHICLADICHNPMIIQMNNVILKMSKYSRMKGIETAIKNNDAASLANATSNLLKVVKHRDIREVEVVVDKIYNLWLEIVLDKKTA